MTGLLISAGAPEQIAGRLKAMEPDNRGSRAAAHETIYAAIYTHPRGGLKAAMIELLRQAKPSRGRRRASARRAAPWSRKPCGLSTARRQIGARLVPGHWEGGRREGAFNRSSVGTLVERKTRFDVLCKMDGNTAEAALEGYRRGENEAASCGYA